MYSPLFNCSSGTATNSPILSVDVVAIILEPDNISILELGNAFPAITKLPSGLTRTTSSFIVSVFLISFFLFSIGF